MTQPTRFVTPNGGIITHEKSGPEGLPAHLLEAIKHADVLVLVGSSEHEGRALSVKQVYAGGFKDEQNVASHAYAHAMEQAHADLIRTVRGEPTDAQRYRAFRDFATMEKSDPARYEEINTMVMRFEEEVLIVDEKKTADYMDKVSDFLVYAISETEPKLQAPTVAPTVN